MFKSESETARFCHAPATAATALRVRSREDTPPSGRNVHILQSSPLRCCLYSEMENVDFVLTAFGSAGRRDGGMSVLLTLREGIPRDTEGRPRGKDGSTGWPSGGGDATSAAPG